MKTTAEHNPHPFQERVTVLFLISLHNGFFKREQIGRLIREIDKNSQEPLSIQFLITDGPSIHNYRALGYNDTEAEKEITRERRKVSNQILNALQDTLVTLTHAHSFATTAWSQVYCDPHFKKALCDIEELYKKDFHLRSIILESSHKALTGMAQCQSLSKAYFNDSEEWRLKEAAHYVLEELALIVASCHMPINQGNKMAVFYYRKWPLLEYVLEKYKDSIELLALPTSV